MKKASPIDRLLSPLGLTLIAVVALIPGIWSLPLLDPAEPRAAHTTVEMMERGEWVVPYFNDAYQFDEPPLISWWMRINFEIFGVNEMGARMHSAQASWLIALLLFAFAKRLGLDRRMAFLAGTAWLTTLPVLIYSRLAMAELPLILFLVLTMATLHKALLGQGKFAIQGLLLSLWLTLSFLTKGPLAYLIPQLALLSSFALFWWQGRQASAEQQENLPDHSRSLWKAQRLLLIALLPSLGLVAIWGITALQASGSSYSGIGISKPVAEQGLGAMDNRLFFPGILAPLIVIPFLIPWSAQLPATLKKSLQARSLNHGFLLGWFISPFLVFSFSPSLLLSHLLPSSPAFFLLLALGYRQEVRLGRFGRGVRNTALALPALLAFALFIIGFMQVTRGKEALDLAFLTILLGGVFFSLAIIAAAAMRREKIARLAIASAFAAFTLFFTLATAIARNAHLTLRLREVTGIPSGSLSAADFNEPSLVWYFDDFSSKQRTRFWSFRALNELTPDQDALTLVTSRRWQMDSRSIWPLLSLQKQIPPVDDHRDQLVARFGAEKIENAEIVTGWSPGTSSWIELLVFRANQ